MTNLKINRIAPVVILMVVVNLTFPGAGLTAETATTTESGIETGDALNAVNADNAINTNQQIIASGDGQDQTTSSTGEPAEEFTFDESETASSTKDEIFTENTAETDNELAATSTTGNNSIENSATSTIDTGDAAIVSDAENKVNINNTGFSGAGGGRASSSLSVDNDNEADVDNESRMDADTGTNEIDDSEGGGRIFTGAATILNSIINYVNNNFFGNGSVFFINIFDYLSDTLHIDGSDDDGGGATPYSELAINNENDVDLHNVVLIDASTGDNMIASSSNGAEIKTGDINIANDIVNIANLNIAGQDWQLAVVNIFGVFDGDVILPPAEPVAAGTEPFEEGAATGTPEFDKEALNEVLGSYVTDSGSELIISNTNDAELVNKVAFDLNTGENEGGDIDAGGVFASSNIFNLVNINYTGNDWRLARVNVFGDWNGRIVGLPPGFEMLDTDYGVTLFNLPTDNEITGLTSINNKNAATTTNDVEIKADTGHNRILNSDGTSNIETGRIGAYSNIFNFLNSNFYGDGWEYSLINVFGEWNGNLAYGRPDLWVSGAVGPRESFPENEIVDYTLLYGNNGNATAEDTIISMDFDTDWLTAHEKAGGVENNGRIEWHIGPVTPNSQASISFSLQVRGDIPAGSHDLESAIFIDSAIEDSDYSDNADLVEIEVFHNNIIPLLLSSSGASGGAPSLQVTKTNDAEGPLRPGDRVNFRIVIKNNGSRPAEEVLVLDVLTELSASSTDLGSNFWDLGTVQSGEEVIIEYTTQIDESAGAGTYVNEVMVEGKNPYSGAYIRGAASSRVRIAENGPIRVLGLSSEPILNLEGYFPRGNVSEPGSSVEARLTVANHGELTAYNVKLAQELPPGLTIDESGGIISKTWEIGDLEPGEIETIEFQIKVSESAGAEVYDMYAVSWADNHQSVRTDKKLFVREVQVLAASGFDRTEMMIVILALLMTIISAFYIDDASKREKKG